LLLRAQVVVPEHRHGLVGRGFRSIARLIGARELELQTPMRIDYDSRVIRRSV
jgi:hypothetical protein